MQVETASHRSEIYVHAKGPNSDLHPWHELVDLRPANSLEIYELSPHTTLCEVVAKFTSA